MPLIATRGTPAAGAQTKNIHDMFRLGIPVVARDRLGPGFYRLGTDFAHCTTPSTHEVVVVARSTSPIDLFAFANQRVRFPRISQRLKGAIDRRKTYCRSFLAQ